MKEFASTGTNSYLVDIVLDVCVEYLIVIVRKNKSSSFTNILL